MRIRGDVTEQQPGPGREAEYTIGSGPVAVLTNAAAGRGRYASLLPAVVARLGARGRRVRVLDVRTRDGAIEACREAVAQRVAALVALGGDGTVHVALQAVAGRDVPLGIVPAGTANDVAAELSGPESPLDACAGLAEAIRAGRTRLVDLGRVEWAGGGREWFGGVLGAGFDAIVNERANRMAFPRGPRRYDLAVLVELARLRPRRYTLRMDGTATRVDAVLIAVGNTARYGGGMRICPEADPTDGYLDVTVGGRIGRGTLLRLKPKVYRGTHVEHPLVSCLRVRQLELSATGITAYADGERIRPLPITVSAVPRALRLLGG